MLNSAAGVMLPTWKYAPPIRTISWTRSMISGARSKAIAMLVSGPSGQRVTELVPSDRSVSMMKSTPCWSCNGMVGSSIFGPSNPVVPCTCSAVTSLRLIGALAPAKTLVSVLPASSQTILAFFSVKGRGTFPATAVTPNTSTSSGEASAKRIATASSCPGSVSMMILRGDI